VDEDEPLFLSLISDLFPGIQLDVAVYADLQKAISAQVASAKLINHPPWNLKVIQVCIVNLHIRHRPATWRDRCQENGFSLRFFQLNRETD